MSKEVENRNKTLLGETIGIGSIYSRVSTLAFLFFLKKKGAQTLDEWQARNINKRVDEETMNRKKK